jgi:hypothetical protein
MLKLSSLSHTSSWNIQKNQVFSFKCNPQLNNNVQIPRFYHTTSSLFATKKRVIGIRKKITKDEPTKKEEKTVEEDSKKSPTRQVILFQVINCIGNQCDINAKTNTI